MRRKQRRYNGRKTPFRYFQDLIEHQGQTIGDNPYIRYENDKITLARCGN